MSIDVAANVLDLVRAANSGAEAEVTVTGGELALTRFANSVIHQNVADASTNVRLRLHVDGRTTAVSATIDLTRDGGALGRLVEHAVRSVRLAPLDSEWPGLAPIGEVQPLPPVDAQTAEAEPAARAARVRDFVAAAGGLVAAGYCSTARLEATFANSAGVAASYVAAQASMDGIVRAPGGDGVARLQSPRLSDLDGDRLGSRAAAKARACADPRELPPGRYEVVLEPTAVVDLLLNFAIWGFNGKAVNEGRSFVEVGTAQFDPAIGIVDDPFDPHGLGAAFDAEGTPKRRTTLVEAGVSAAVAYDRRCGAQAGVASTGHALAGAAAFGAVATNLQLLPAGDDTEVPGEVEGPVADASVQALVAQVGRGLLVSDFWYTGVLDPRSLVMTGSTRNGVWLIEDGRVTAPVQNLRFTQSYPQALAPGAVLGVGSHAIGVPAEIEVLAYRVPALRLASWNFTGNASG
ncbi:MAG TPA: metallopeptidase TldD-related protein [Micromonosporaceae bacterium]|jgi:predicted Zn-dependent protease